MPRYQISHRTSYAYATPVIQSHHLLHLAPREVAHQQILRHSLIIEPAPSVRHARTDYFGNPAEHLSLEDEHREFSVTALSDIVVTPPPVPDLQASRPWDAFERQQITAAEGLDRSVLDFACRSRHGAPTQSTSDFARALAAPAMPVLVFADALMGTIHNDFRFDNATTDVSTPVDRVLEQKSGVCQDFAHLMIACLRALGVPARYVSGYIRTVPPEGQERLAGADASHAWVSVWCPEFGWVDFDPTNNLINSPDHITIAYGRDFEDVSPITGVLLGGGEHTVAVAVDVLPQDGRQEGMQAEDGETSSTPASTDAGATGADGGER